MILFEFPLTEQVRTWLRLEMAWSRWLHFIAGENPDDHHAALIALFECVDIAARSDLKRHLLAALTELVTFCPKLSLCTPLLPKGISLEVSQLIETLQAQPLRLEQLVRQQPLLDALRTRTHLPGGVCGFDLPAYHYWLAQPAAERRADLTAWTKPAEPLFIALTAVLAHLRTQGVPQSVTAVDGVFEQPLTGKLPRLVQIGVAASDRVVPKVAANKYQLNLYFASIECNSALAERYQGPKHLSFRLALCY